MKWLVGLLVVVNIVLFAFFKLSVPQAGGIVAGHQPINPEKLNILTLEQLAAMPKKQPPSTPVAAPEPALACYEWGSFSSTNFTQAKKALEKFSVEATVRQTEAQEARRYWVYIPPRRSLQEALSKNEELHAMGISDTFVVQEPQWRNAISFGIFKDEALANKLLDDLHGRGVTQAVKGVRNHEKGQSGFFIKNVTSNVADEIGKLKPDFPGSELKQVDCQ